MPLKKFVPRPEDDENVDEVGIRIRMISEDQRLPSSFLTESIKSIEEELFGVESQELSDLLGIIEPISDGTRQECFRAMNRHRGTALTIDHAGDGSIVLEAIAIGGLAYWIIENTVGESFKEAWKRSDLHMKLQDLFLARLSWRRKQTQERLTKRLEASDPSSNVVGTVGYERDGRALIAIDLVLKNRKAVAPSPSEWLVKDRKNRKREAGGSERRMAA
jgi:hypothetical protein